jgi:hypothetical protein
MRRRSATSQQTRGHSKWRLLEGPGLWHGYAISLDGLPSTLDIFSYAKRKDNQFTVIMTKSIYSTAARTLRKVSPWLGTARPARMLTAAATRI